MNKKEFCDRLSELLAQKGRSDRDVSLALGRNPGYINSIIKGRSYPSMEVFFEICEELGITAVDFFDTETRYPEMINRTIPYLSLLDEEELNTVTGIVQAIASKK